MLKQLLLIGAGGFFGSIARYLVSRLNTHIEWFAIPLGTLTVNVAGSLLIGFLIGISEKSPILTVEWRMFLMVGLCGGFTTFSTFGYETLTLLRDAEFTWAVLSVLMHLIAGLAAVWIGDSIGRVG